MSWQKELNKKLEEQRLAFQESLDSGEADKRKRSYSAKSGGKVTGKKHVESGHLKSITKYWNSEEAVAAGKLAGAKNVESGSWDKTREQGTKAASLKRIAEKESRYPEFLSHLPENGITEKMAEEAAVLIGYAKRQGSRLLHATCELEKIVKDKAGRNRWQLCTWKKK